MIEVGAEGNIPGFDEQLLGMSAGDTKTFTLAYPDDYPEEELAGEEAEFTVNVKEVRAKEVPPLDDALAAKITNGKIETLDAFKADIRADMARSLADSAERQVESGLVDKIVSASTIKYPPVLVESEVEDDAKQFMARLEREQVTLDEYFARTGRTREQLMGEFQQAAVKRIEIGLVLGEIAEKENLGVTPEDIDAAIAAQAEQQRTTPPAMRAMLESNGALSGLVNRAQTKKVLDFLRASAIIKEKEVSSDQADPADLEDAAEDAAEKIEMDSIDTTESSNA